MWGTEEEAAFRKLKEALTSAPILQVFDKDKPHEVWVDATLSAPRRYNKMITQSNGCQWNTFPTASPWLCRIMTLLTGNSYQF